MKAHLVSKYKRPMDAGDAPEPAVGDHEVLVDIHAAGVNVLDAKIRDGEFKVFLPYKAPFILGHDVAGIVSRVGNSVTRSCEPRNSRTAGTNWSWYWKMPPCPESG